MINNERMLFRYYLKTERRYIEWQESKNIMADDLSRIKSLAIEQCTGFRDKWSELIFEGDIIKDETGNVGIVFYDCARGQYLFGDYWKLSDKKFEIIGNCHEK